MGHPLLPAFRPGHHLTAAEMETVSRLLDRKIRGIDVMSSPSGTTIWHRPQPGGQSGAATIRFEVIASGPFVYEELPVCQSILGRVQDVSCGETSISIGDEVIIWDPSQCWLTVPLDLLLGSHGTAVEMSREGTWETIEDCFDAGILVGNCWWMVTGLCCVENIYGG